MQDRHTQPEPCEGPLAECKRFSVLCFEQLSYLDSYRQAYLTRALCRSSGWMASPALRAVCSSWLSLSTAALSPRVMGATRLGSSWVALSACRKAKEKSAPVAGDDGTLICQPAEKKRESLRLLVIMMGAYYVSLQERKGKVCACRWS